MNLAYFMHKTDKASFVGLFNEWKAKWASFLRERSVGADASLTTFIKIWEAPITVLRGTYAISRITGALDIPNTNNGIEAAFGDLMSLLRRHKGFSIEHWKSLIFGIFFEPQPS